MGERVLALYLGSPRDGWHVKVGGPAIEDMGAVVRSIWIWPRTVGIDFRLVLDDGSSHDYTYRGPFLAKRGEIPDDDGKD